MTYPNLVIETEIRIYDEMKEALELYQSGSISEQLVMAHRDRFNKRQKQFYNHILADDGTYISAWDGEEQFIKYIKGDYR